MKTFTLTLLAASALTLIACGSPSDSGDVTVEDVPTAEITRTEIKSEAVLSAERTSAGMAEQGERLVEDAKDKADDLKDISETIKTKTAENAERLKADGMIDGESAAQMKEAADAKAKDLERSAETLVEDAKAKAEAMKDTGEKMVAESKEAKPE